MTPLFSTLGAALLFAAVFLWGGRVHPFRRQIPDRRVLISFGAGMSAAYVFVHLMPELHGARTAFAESFFVRLRFEGMAIYYVGLIGFLVFYGLDVLRARLHHTGGVDEEESGPAFKLHVGGFAAYVWLMAYLLVNNLEASAGATGLYALSIGFHFLAVDYSLRQEYGNMYQRLGRPLLAAMSLLGWVTGQWIELPPYVVALLVAFISGAIIMNSTIMELPTEKDGRFVPFLIGGLGYGLLLMPLG